MKGVLADGFISDQEAQFVAHGWATIQTAAPCGPSDRLSTAEVHTSRRILRERLEDLRDRFALQPLAPHVRHDAHDREPRTVGTPRAQLESSGHGIAPWPRPPSRRIVDHCDRRSIRSIPDRKEATAEQRRPKSPEEVHVGFGGHRTVIQSGVPTLDQLLPPASLANSKRELRRQ